MQTCPRNLTSLLFPSGCLPSNSRFGNEEQVLVLQPPADRGVLRYAQRARFVAPRQPTSPHRPNQCTVLQSCGARNTQCSIQTADSGPSDCFSCVTHNEGHDEEKHNEAKRKRFSRLLTQKTLAERSSSVAEPRAGAHKLRSAYSRGGTRDGKEEH